jgi:MFS family permease
VASGASTFAMGYLANRIPGRVLGAIGFALLSISGVITIYANTLPLVFLSMAVFGLGIGGMMFLQNYIWAEYFGREHLGAIRGVVMPVTLIIGAIGAPTAGYVYDRSGSYDSIWWVGVAIMAGAAILGVTIKAPTHPSEQIVNRF